MHLVSFTVFALEFLFFYSFSSEITDDFNVCITTALGSSDCDSDIKDSISEMSTSLSVEWARSVHTTCGGEQCYILHASTCVRQLHAFMFGPTDLFTHFNMVCIMAKQRVNSLFKIFE